VYYIADNYNIIKLRKDSLVIIITYLKRGNAFDDWIRIIAVSRISL